MITRKDISALKKQWQSELRERTDALDRYGLLLSLVKDLDRIWKTNPAAGRSFTSQYWYLYDTYLDLTFRLGKTDTITYHGAEIVDKIISSNFTVINNTQDVNGWHLELNHRLFKYWRHGKEIPLKIRLDFFVAGSELCRMVPTGKTTIYTSSPTEVKEYKVVCLGDEKL